MKPPGLPPRKPRARANRPGSRVSGQLARSRRAPGSRSAPRGPARAHQPARTPRPLHESPRAEAHLRVAPPHEPAPHGSSARARPARPPRKTSPRAATTDSCRRRRPSRLHPPPTNPAAAALPTPSPPPRPFPSPRRRHRLHPPPPARSSPPPPITLPSPRPARDITASLHRLPTRPTAAVPPPHPTAVCLPALSALASCSTFSTDPSLTPHARRPAPVASRSARHLALHEARPCPRTTTPIASHHGPVTHLRVSITLNPIYKRYAGARPV